MYDVAHICPLKQSAEFPAMVAKAPLKTHMLEGGAAHVKWEMIRKLRINNLLDTSVAVFAKERMSVDSVFATERIQKIRWYDENLNYLFRFDPNDSISVGAQKAWSKRAVNVIKHESYDALVLIDYGKYEDEFWEPVYKAVEDLGDKKKIFVHSKRAWPDLPHATAYRNKSEGPIIAKRHIVTHGAEGVYDGSEFHENTNQNITVKDVCGAGDVFLANHVLRTLEKKFTPVTAMKAAMHVATVSVTKPLTGFQYQSQVKQ